MPGKVRTILPVALISIAIALAGCLGEGKRGTPPVGSAVVTKAPTTTTAPSDPPVVLPASAAETTTTTTTTTMPATAPTVVPPPTTMAPKPEPPPVPVGTLINGVNTPDEIAAFAPSGDATLEVSKDWKSEGEASLKVTYKGGYVVAQNFRIAALPGSKENPADWSAYKTFRFDIHNGGTVEVDFDTQIKGGTRYRQGYVKLAPNETKTVEIDLAKVKDAENDLTKIVQINLMARVPVGQTGILFYDNFQLGK